MIGYPRWLASLLHRLFGLHFVEVGFCDDDYILRIRQAPVGYLYVRLCGQTLVVQKDGGIPGRIGKARGFTFNFKAGQ